MPGVEETCDRIIHDSLGLTWIDLKSVGSKYDGPELYVWLDHEVTPFLTRDCYSAMGEVVSEATNASFWSGLIMGAIIGAVLVTWLRTRSRQSRP